VPSPTPPDFSVLLLAWDEADPAVVVLGGAALPPTLPLVYRLAARQPVLAVYPHLPEAGEGDKPARKAAENSESIAPGTPKGPNPAALTSDPEAAEAAPATKPGVRALPVQAGTGPARASQLVGLDELSPVAAASVRLALETTATISSPLPNASRRSQWPSSANVVQPRGWQAPAAPYAGASAPVHLPPPPRVPNPAPRATTTVREAADLTKAALGPTAPLSAPTLRLNAHPQAGDLRFDPDPELPAVRRPEAFDEPTGEVGPAEALALSVAADDITPEVPLPTPAVAPEQPALQPAAPAPEVRLPILDGLNFRMIQYARQAAQLVRERCDFGVIYAPNWPAWLAALEIRNSTGRPLVLYAASLVTDFTSPAERGWLLEVERMALRRARLILVPDEDVRRQLQATYGATIGEVRVVPAADEAAVQRVLSEVAGE
jgi:hypothetical protein